MRHSFTDNTAEDDLEWADALVIDPETYIGPWSDPTRTEDGCWRYLGYGIPNFWLAEFLLLIGVVSIVEVVGITGRLAITGLASFVLGLSLLAAQLRYVRAESREYLFSEFVTLLRAKGATDFVVAKHLLRNAAIPLTSLFFAELLGVMVVNVFILERVLGIRGIGFIGLRAIQAQDLPVVMGIAVIIAIIGVVGNLIQDLVFMAVDPRIQVE